MATKITIRAMEKLLKAAERGHKKYEERTGRRDRNWPGWYARFIVEKINKTNNKKDG